MKTYIILFDKRYALIVKVLNYFYMLNKAIKHYVKEWWTLGLKLSIILKENHFTISELTLKETYTLKGENSYTIEIAKLKNSIFSDFKMQFKTE